MPPHPLTNFEFYGVYSINDLPKIKEGAYVINLDEYKPIETHWIALYVNDDNVTYFGSYSYWSRIYSKRNQKVYRKNILQQIFIK